MLRAELLPTIEDWAALQGGRPRMFQSPAGMVEVAHIYDPVFDPQLAGLNSRLPHYGCVIPTIGDRFKDSLENPIEIEFKRQAEVFPLDPDVDIDDENYTPVFESIRRVVRVPAVMLIAHHGKACAQQSIMAGAKSSDAEYEKIRNQKQMEQYIGSRITAGFIELRLAPSPVGNGFTTIPVNR